MERRKIKEGNRAIFKRSNHVNKGNLNMIIILNMPTILNIVSLLLQQIKTMDNKIFFKTHIKKSSRTRKDVWEEYNTLKQHIFFFPLTHENWQRESPGLCPGLTSGILLRKKKLHESVQPCFVLHECFNRAEIVI